jgi:tetratricopeptide (TPR) repeat protein
LSTLRFQTLNMPAADLGPENPLPPLINDQELHVAQSVDPAVPAEMRRNMAYGHLSNLLPYSMQDGYNRERKPRDFKVAVLENEILRATFLLELGGRLWSLVHKPSRRELLSVNPVFQPANLALRNAWFNGGVEWNIGTIGHTPFTCVPLFAARVDGQDGLPVLRMYEWERIRQVTYQIDAWLPDDSLVLFVRVCIRNPRDREVPMYWWSNIAVPETPGTRVLVPADSAYRYTYDRLNVIPVPIHEGVDITYATNINRAADFFFHIPEDRLPWIAALDEQGKGLVQVSTPRLKGRKLFVWGMGRGGRKWQEFLSVPGQAYIEIQAGLARTQLEHLPMPARAEWEWLEAYGLLEVNAGQAHGPEWNQAAATVTEAVEALIPRHKLESELARSAAFVNQPPAEIIQRGSGWGALERLRREAAGEAQLCTAGLVFDEQSIGTEQAPWLTLLKTGQFPTLVRDAVPAGNMVQDEWQALLEKTADRENWLACLHLGVMRFYRQDYAGARQAWEMSLQLVNTPWALRNLAVLARMEGRTEDAAAHYVAACRLKPDLLPLAAECGKFLVETGYAQQWLNLLSELNPALRSKGRICLLEAQARLALGQMEQAREIIDHLPVIEDIREGELSLSQLWFNYHAKRLSVLENHPIDDDLLSRVRREFPLPPELDFRMSED